MPNFPISRIKFLNDAIVTHNPFGKPAIVKDQDIWVNDFPNAKRLNDKAIETIFQAIEQAKNQQNQVISIVISADKGTGKTHLIRCIRQHIHIENIGLFVYVNVQQFNDFHLIRHQLLQIVIDNLRHFTPQGVMQWQELASEMANQALKMLNPQTRNFAAKELVKKLDTYNLEKNLAWINQLTEAYFRHKPNIIDPDIVRAIFWTLVNSQAPFAIKWLGGKSLSDWKIEELGLPNHSRDVRDSEAFDILLQIFHIISYYKNLVIAFDNLDSLENNDNNLRRERIVAGIVKHLSDKLNMINLDRGIVILTAMTPDTWINKIKNLPTGIADRICGNTSPIDLKKYINGEEILDLVSTYLEDFYTTRNLNPPRNVYPFDEYQLTALGREKLNISQILFWCSENFNPIEIDPIDQLEELFNELLKINIPDLNYKYLNDKYFIAKVIGFALENLQGETIEGVTIEKVSIQIVFHPLNHGYINLCIIGKEAGEIITIGIAILENSPARNLAAGLKRLIQYETFRLTRGCLLRSYNNIIHPHWQAYNYLQKLTNELGGKWVDLNLNNLQPLIAIWSLQMIKDKYNLTSEQIQEFIQIKRIAIDNQLIRDILRKPDNNIQKNKIDEQSITLNEQANNTIDGYCLELECT